MDEVLRSAAPQHASHTTAPFPSPLLPLPCNMCRQPFKLPSVQLCAKYPIDLAHSARCNLPRTLSDRLHCSMHPHVIGASDHTA